MTAPGSRLFTLCADDFGQSAAINEGIFDLLRLRRLGAVSVMSQGPAWPDGASALHEYQSMADIGLHLNLTHDFGHSPAIRPLGWWLVAAPLGFVKRDAIRAAFQSQLDAFAKHFGRLPDYLDGHQHVHALPAIRDVLTELIADNWRGRPLPWVRAPDRLLEAGPASFKARVLRAATHGFAGHAAQAGLRYTKRFGGLYALTPDAAYPALMRRWLHELPSGTLMMVHPGKPGVDASDPIGAARVEEFNYLHGDGFAQDALSADAAIVRFADLPA